MPSEIVADSRATSPGIRTLSCRTGAGSRKLSLGIGALQLMLDRGELKDWFHSSEIWIEATVAGLGFYLFTVHTATTGERSFLNGDLLKSANFVAGTLLMFIVGLIMTGTSDKRKRAVSKNIVYVAGHLGCESLCATGEPEFRAVFGAWCRPVGVLGRRARPRLVNEALGRHIQRTSFAASRSVDVERGLPACWFSRQRNLVIDRLGVVGE